MGIKSCCSCIFYLITVLKISFLHGSEADNDKQVHSMVNARNDKQKVNRVKPLRCVIIAPVLFSVLKAAAVNQSPIMERTLQRQDMPFLTCRQNLL